METNYASQVAAEVRAEMARQSLTARELSAATFIPGATLSRRLNAKSPFTVNELHDISTHLGVPIRQLLPEHAVTTSAAQEKAPTCTNR